MCGVMSRAGELEAKPGEARREAAAAFGKAAVLLERYSLVEIE